MDCSNCQRPVPNNSSFCPDCESKIHILPPIEQSLPLASTSHQRTIQHLEQSVEQASTLRHIAWRQALFVAAFITVFMVFFMPAFILSGFEYSFIWIGVGILVFIALFTLVCLQRFRSSVFMFQDAKAGIIYTQKDRVEKKFKYVVKTRRDYYIFFEQLGKVNVSREQFDRFIEQQVYELSYSPQSKHIWEFTQL